MPREKDLTFTAIKYKYTDDEDGEAFLVLRVDMKSKLSAFAVPAKKLLRVTIKIIK